MFKKKINNKLRKKRLLIKTNIKKFKFLFGLISLYMPCVNFYENPIICLSRDIELDMLKIANFDLNLIKQRSFEKIFMEF